MPAASMAISSPGSTSRTIVAPMMSSAAVSLATTQPRSRRPSTSGRTPCWSRAAYRVCSSANTSENAPRSRGSSRSADSSTPVSAAVAASSSATRSESVVDWTARRSLRPAPVAPPRAESTSSRSCAVFTRLPLWPSAIPLPAAVVRKVGWAFSQVVEPVVEYRQCPTAR
jgi:hypothetical protein